MSSIPPYEPPRAPLSEAEPHDGSVWGGIGMAWLIMVLGEALLLPSGTLSLGLLPPVVILIAGIVKLSGDTPRTGKGLLLGLASIFAVVLLLVAACFGMLRGGIGE
jgi:hypothetical protein